MKILKFVLSFTHPLRTQEKELACLRVQNKAMGQKVLFSVACNLNRDLWDDTDPRDQPSGKSKIIYGGKQANVYIPSRHLIGSPVARCGSISFSLACSITLSRVCETLPMHANYGLAWGGCVSSAYATMWLGFLDQVSPSLFYRVIQHNLAIPSKVT